MTYFLVPKNYQTAYFLTEDDKKIMAWRAETSAEYSGGTGKYTKKDIRAGAKDITTWIHAVIQIMVVTILYGKPSASICCEALDESVLTTHLGFGTFLPIILKNGFNYSTKEAQYFVIPVNLWGAFVYAIGAWLSDRYKKRVTIMLAIAPIGIAGYAILLAWDVPAGVQYFSTYLIATACFLCTGGNIAWLSGNRAPDGKRAASLGIQLTLTNIGGVVVSISHACMDESGSC